MPPKKPKAKRDEDETNDYANTLIIRRDNVVKRLRNSKKFFENIDIITPENIYNVEARLDCITKSHDEFLEVHIQIEELQPQDEDDNDEIQESFDNEYFSIISKVRRDIDAYYNSQKLTNMKKVDQNQTLFSQPQLPTQNVKLATLPLPKFSGKFTEWRSYRDTIQNILCNNSAIGNSVKLQYLKSTLEGEPAKRLQAFETTDDNFEIAWNLLRERYENQRRIVDNHVNEILTLPVIKKSSYTELKNLISTLENNLRCLENLNQNVDAWDALLIPIIISKLSADIVAEWEKCLSETNTTKVPTKTEFLQFLNKHLCVLEALSHRREQVKDQPPAKFTQKSFATFEVSCPNCTKPHYINQCETFLKLSPQERSNRIKALKLCINCLRKGHLINQCQSSLCRKCQKPHHTLLHFDQPSIITKPTQNTDQTKQKPSQNYSLHTQAQVILPTAQVHVKNKRGETVVLRALLDSASQSNFITNQAAELLSLDKTPASLNVSGIGCNLSKIKHSVIVEVKSKINNFKFNILCLLISEISDKLPSDDVDTNLLQIPSNIQLADENYYKAKPVDLIIGAEIFFSLLSVGQINTEDSITLQKSKLGWLVCGPSNDNLTLKTAKVYHSTTKLEQDLKRFWEINEPEIQPYLSPQDQYCEELYESTTYQAKDSKFVVRMPLNAERLTQLGDSFDIAKTRFLSLEKRFRLNPEYKTEYTKVMHDYISQRHASLSKREYCDEFFLPHHGVVKTQSTSTKLRIVFDASCKLEEGLSLNDVQFTGPTIMNELFPLLINYRLYKYVIIGDLTQMYRQIWVHTDDRKYQKIIWRDNPEEPLQIYNLNTVTFGTTAAPFLAIRTLKQIAKLNKNVFPSESDILNKYTYVDDVFICDNDLSKILEIKDNITKILQQYHFTLTKFQSNITTTFDQESDIESSMFKVLGIRWNPITDNIIFEFKRPKYYQKITKRIIVSTIAKCFDPTGLIEPVFVKPKILLQKLWKLSLEWDESVPLEIHTQFNEHLHDMHTSNIITIPRHIVNFTPTTTYELHGFSDASQYAYGACIYLVSRSEDSVKSHLLAAKSKVAPIRSQTITLPRLELMGAVLLSKLITKIRSLPFPFTEFLWCDSQIVLHWINSDPSKWNLFVTNRVASIQRSTDVKKWRYVKTNENPADILSRGKTLSELKTCQLWWHGPDFLNYDINTSGIPDLDNVPEQKIKAFTSHLIKEKSFMENFSSLNRLLRVTAYCLRFIKKHNYTSTVLTSEELEYALNTHIKFVQAREFHSEYMALKRYLQTNKNSKLYPLSPFLCKDGLIRVGGRLQRSNFSFNKRHPILLPRDSHLTTIIIRKVHTDNCHTGPNSTLAHVRETFWPISGLNTVKKIVRSCVTCFRVNPKSTTQLLGSLPEPRVVVSYPFYSTGIDYAGPINIKDRQGRGAKTNKAYIALFVCFATKCVHLELVTSLSTDAFFNAFSRFISRRGKPRHIFSDNGTNFEGANSELKVWYTFLKDNNNEIAEKIENQKISWHFNPPDSPHMGGLWESSVKSAKLLLKKAIGLTLLTFEDMYCLLAKIESILNSRPMIPLSSDPNDAQALTPYHFVIGRSAIALPEPDVTHLKINQLNRFQFIQRIAQDFWNQWSTAYITTLQTRQKWKTRMHNIKVGALVLLKQDNLPPGQWRLGRVEVLHPGQDNCVRVVTVKCQSGLFKRNVTKLCELPID